MKWVYVLQSGDGEPVELPTGQMLDKFISMALEMGYRLDEITVTLKAVPE